MFQNFAYDPNGNRLTLNQELNKTISYLYKEKSNILQTIAHYKRVDENNTIKEQEQNLTYDKAGNITGLTSDDNASALSSAGLTHKHIYTYDAKNRLIKIDNNITYTYNYKNQRVSKTIDNKTTYYIYDDYKLIGQYQEDGTPIKEYIYLDDTPIAILQDNKVYYIYADHLNTPRRVVTSDTNTIVWKWESKPFGEDKPTGTYELNLRFPGQYFDKESGFSYNINRYYNPTLGRYMQSDPIGLDGGENSFVYVGDNPLGRVDSKGLVDLNLFKPGDTIYYYAMQHGLFYPGYTVGAHGVPIVDQRDGGFRDITPFELVEIMRKNGYNGGPVSLLVCNAGTSFNGEASYAQILSRILNTTVYAPTSNFYYGPLGIYSTGDGKGLKAFFPWN